MANEEITISELELADEVLADMVLAVDTTTDTKAVTLSQIKAWLGSSLPTGFILPAVGKISDERFTLLDGKTLARTGSYEAFCNKVIEQVQAGNWFSCTETEFNQDVATYGQCGRFVITNDYVRIPLITRYIGATVTLSEIGRTYAESLPNITGEVGSYGISGTGAFQQVSQESRQSTSSAGYYWHRSDFDASRSSSTYQNNAKVNPEHTKFPYYMVVSTNGQTEEIEVDINEVYEDLNLKANSDLSNVPNSKGILVESYQNGTSWYRLYSDGWCEQGGKPTGTNSSRIPVNLLKPYKDTNYIILNGFANTSGTSDRNDPIVISNITTSGFEMGIQTASQMFEMWLAVGYVN